MNKASSNGSAVASETGSSTHRANRAETSSRGAEAGSWQRQSQLLVPEQLSAPKKSDDEDTFFEDTPLLGVPPPNAADLGNEKLSAAVQNVILELTADGFKAFSSGNASEAKLFYQMAASHDGRIALHNLGTMYLHGQGIPHDYSEAYQCFRRCADLGLSQSMGQLGYMHLHGRGVKKDTQAALFWFSKSVELNSHDAYSQFHLGMLHLLGAGVERDPVAGSRHLQRSADESYVPALYNLGVLYMSGLKGLPKDTARAVKLLKRAAILRDPYAQNNLGTLYASGTEVEQDLRKAYTLFRLAATRGVSAAMFNLGEMYNSGFGVPPDATMAAKYYLRAATTTENAGAEFQLASMFLTGKGAIEQNLDLSLQWFERAAEHGHKGARNNVQVLRSPRFMGVPRAASVREQHTQVVV